MMSQPEIDTPGPSALILGPGPRAREIASVLVALACSRCPGAAPLWCRRLDDLEDLLSGRLAESIEGSGEDSQFGMAWISRGPGVTPTKGLLLLEASSVPPDDIGFVRRFLERQPDWHLFVLDGEDPSAESAQKLRLLERSGTLPNSPDLDQLAALLDLPPLGSEPSVGPGLKLVLADPGDLPHLPESSTSPVDADRREAQAEAPEAGQHGEDEELFCARRQDMETEEDPFATLDEAALEATLVSALLSQDEEPRVAELPSQTTELGALVEELLAADALGGSSHPRTIFRCLNPYPINLERADLVENIGGMLGLARLAAGNSGVVSVQITTPADESGALLRIDFPAGELGGSGIEELLERAESGARDPADRFGRALSVAARSAAQLRDMGAEPSLSELEDRRLRLAVEFPQAALQSAD
ncbi:MAG: hypothetical protein ACI8QS_001033 [Planctomycetota bacterium]|jgi:hypothetical protein